MRDGYPPQTNIVHVDGGRAVLLTVLKNGAASTLDIVDGVKAHAAELRSDAAGERSRSTLLGDQSLFVEGAITGVVARR